MARPSKAAKAAAEASKAAENPAPRVIDPVAFVRVRDSVFNRLATIQDLIKSFSHDYLRQTNLLLGEGTNIDEEATLEQFQNVLSAPLVPVAVAPPVEEKKERKKRTHDPNAPKRPLTPYFLYMQTARPIIANDLGQDAPKGAVQDEGQRRWSVMSPGEKAGWNTAYQYNLRLYNARVHSYKNGNPEAKNMSDDEAREYADTHSIELPSGVSAEEPGANDQQAIADQLNQTNAEAEEGEPTKTPKKGKAASKRKTGTPAAESEAKPVATPASPDKKRKRTSKAAELAEEPKKSGRKKTKSG
ncbi:hypothetical protein GQ53DRAFT_741508 [Thozetella sp. PMI_491]|nr:hypothetical protein GQ53DRAFT_741508 [Thozetella sp. PMI_491]